MIIFPIARHSAARSLATNAQTWCPILLKFPDFVSGKREYAQYASIPLRRDGQGELRRRVRSPEVREGIKMYPLANVRESTPWSPTPRSDGKVLEVALSKQKPGRTPSEMRESTWVPVSARWLRDNCACKECRNQDTGQRQINVLKGKVDFSIQNVEVLNGGEAFLITFGDGHKTEYTKSQLLGRKGSITTHKRQGLIPFTTWNSTVESAPPTVPYHTIETEGLGPLLRNIRQFGFCFVDGLPATPEATETLLAAIGPIRNTHYGGFYDFTADLSSKDTAYTSESLEPHTDNTYFTEPTGLQALHLLSHTEGSGGESSLVDGFAAAARLYEEDPEAYKTLSWVGVHAHASGNEGISIQPSHAVPVLSHDPRRGYLTQVRWNNADRAGVDCSFSTMDKWYDAAAKFDAILSDPSSQYWFQLTPGKMLIFDNWRVLHGRAAFTGKRRMCGGYINRDDFISRYRATNMSAEDIRASTVTG